jgi:hypothetical protein
MTTEFDASWRDVGPALLDSVQLGRAAAASSSMAYTPAVLAETGQNAAPVGTIVPAQFITAAPDGRSMEVLLSESVIVAKSAVRDGATATEALARSQKWLTGVVLTVIADTGRAVVGADIAQRPRLTGYVRMLNAPSCARCVILAGKWFRWNEGFQRHPRCDCRHIPGSENVVGDARTDPYEYFRSLSNADQEKLFGRIEARSIRDGGDIYRVMNTKTRGLATAKGRLRFGSPSRLTVDDIYRTAGTRTNAIRMMQQEGYITGPQTVGGNIIGQVEGFGQMGKGGAARAASDAVTAARTSGVRDPLNRYTMTAAERRLFDAKTRLDIARTGIFPRSIGANSADLYSKPRAVTASELRMFQDDLRREVSKLTSNPVTGSTGSPDSVILLARLLGLI